MGQKRTYKQYSKDYKEEAGNLTTLNHTLPTVWRAKKSTIINPLRGNNNKLI